MKKRPLAYTAIFLVLGEALGLMALWQGIVLCILFLIIAGWKEKSTFAIFLLGILFGFYLQGMKAKEFLVLEKEKEGTMVTVTGTVTASFEGENSYFHLKTNELGEKTIQIKVYTDLILPQKGDVVLIKGELSGFSEPTNPGEFHAYNYYHSIGISYQCYLEDITILKENKNLFFQLSKKYSQTIKSSYFKFMESENAGILSGIVLGDKTEIVEEDKIRYQEAGISHILAISGLHMGCVGMGIFRFLRKRRWSYGSSAFFALFVLAFYTIMVGNSVSMERAFLMMFITLLGEVLGRKSDLLTTLSLVAAVVVVKNPYVLLHSTFYLSFLAVFSLAIFPTWIEKIWEGSSIWKKYFMAGFCIQLGLFPVFAESNHYLPTYSFLTNFLVLFFFTYFLIFSFLLSLVCFFFPEITEFWFQFVEIFLEGIRFVTKVNEMLPFNKIRISHNPWWWYGIYYVLIFLSFYLMEKGIKIKNKRYILIIFLFSIFFLGMYGYHHQGRLHVAVLDVGQGDGILIKQEGGINLMIDGGSSSKKQVGKYVLAPAMDYYGIEQIDYAFLSHLDKDHICGVIELLELGRIKKVVLSSSVDYEELKQSDLMQYLNEENIMIVTQGMEFYAKDLKIKILHPEKEKAYKDGNEASMVLEISYHDKTFLFTGDISQETEETLLGKMSKEIDLLKVSHHGSKYSTSDRFLEGINAKNAVISCGKNTYGHPSEEVLERLTKRGVRIHNTMQDGAMVFVVP